MLLFPHRSGRIDGIVLAELPVASRLSPTAPALGERNLAPVARPAMATLT